MVTNNILSHCKQRTLQQWRISNELYGDDVNPMCKIHKHLDFGSAVIVNSNNCFALIRCNHGRLRVKGKLKWMIRNHIQLDKGFCTIPFSTVDLENKLEQYPRLQSKPHVVLRKENFGIRMARCQNKIDKKIGRHHTGEWPAGLLQHW